MTFPQLTLVSWGNVDYRTFVFCNSLQNQFTEFTWCIGIFIKMIYFLIQTHVITLQRLYFNVQFPGSATDELGRGGSLGANVNGIQLAARNNHSGVEFRYYNWT